MGFKRVILYCLFISGFSGPDCDSKAETPVSLSSLTTPSTMASSSSLQTVTLSTQSSSTPGKTSTITDSVSSSSLRLTAITDSSSTTSSRLTATTDSSSTSSSSQRTSSLKPTTSSVDLHETSEANPTTDIVRPGISSAPSNPVTVKERVTVTSSLRTSRTELSTQDRADISTEYHVIGTTSAIKRNIYDIPGKVILHMCVVKLTK